MTYFIATACCALFAMFRMPEVYLFRMQEYGIARLPGKHYKILIYFFFFFSQTFNARYVIFTNMEVSTISRDFRIHLYLS